MGSASFQARVEASKAGRVVLSVLILVILLCVLVTQLPRDTYARKTLEKKTQPVLNAIGLDQNWGVFAPDPRRESLGLKARISYPDGSTETWEPPDRNPVIGTYSDYRWRKLMENVLADEGNRDRSYRFAQWVARTQRSRRDVPTSVVLIKRAAPNQPAGSKQSDGPYTETPIFTQEVSAKSLKGGTP